MAGIVEFPQIVEEALRDFGDLLPNEPQRRHFAEYLTGLFVADRKNVTGINREFAQTTDPSCLNRFLRVCPIRGGQLGIMGYENPTISQRSDRRAVGTRRTPDPCVLRRPAPQDGDA
jgi:hypothetical protein